jgi:hypothetical protein
LTDSKAAHEIAEDSLTAAKQLLKRATPTPKFMAYALDIAASTVLVSTPHRLPMIIGNANTNTEAIKI